MALGSGETFSIGTSVEGRPIEVTRLGTGPVAVAFIGDIHGGWEPMARDVVVAGLDHFRTASGSVPPQVSLYFIPTINPDGYEVGKALLPQATGTGGVGDARLAVTAFNARGVDLNRNFPIRWSSLSCGGEKYLLQFGKICGTASGPRPFSEPETIAYRDFVLERHIWLAMTYHEDQTPSVSVREGGGGASEPLALQMSQLLHYPYLPVWTEYPVNGQAQDWLDSVGVLGVEIELKYRTLDQEHNISAMQLAIERAIGEEAST